VRLALSALLAVSASACGFAPATTTVTARVRAVGVAGPYAAIGSCLTRELRLVLASRARRGARADLLLAADLVGVDLAPETLVRDAERTRPVEERVDLRLEVRLTDGRTGAAVWGPRAYTAAGLAREGPTAAATAASADVAFAVACRDLAARVADDVALVLARAAPRGPAREEP
jgi:hypothetical protein